jgi:hypothetical protein
MRVELLAARVMGNYTGKMKGNVWLLLGWKHRWPAIYRRERTP